MALAELHLALLMSGARHGYELKQAHDAWFPDQRPLAFGQVYATLARLVRDGFAEVVETAAKGGPERTVYAVTDAGRQRLLKWVSTPVRPSGLNGEDLMRRSIAALHITDAEIDAVKLIAEQRLEHLRCLQLLRQAAQPSVTATSPKLSSVAMADQLGGHLARRNLLLSVEAELQWLEEASATLQRVTDKLSTAGAADEVFRSEYLESSTAEHRPAAAATP